MCRLCGLLWGRWNCRALSGEIFRSFHLVIPGCSVLNNYSTFCSLLLDSGRRNQGRNRAPYFLCGSLSEEGENIKIGSNSQKSPLLNVPLGTKKGPKLCQDAVEVQDVEKDKLQNITYSGDFLPLAASCENLELGDGQEDGHGEEPGAGAIVLAGLTVQENSELSNSKAGESPKDFEVFLLNLLHCIECDGTLTKVVRDGYATEVLRAS